VSVYDKNQKILDQVESKKYLDSEIERSARYIPDIDFKKPENFVKYGSAEKYYKDSIERIYKTYPFDGSMNEVLEWKNSSSYLDLYIFENLYPRNTGYISLASEQYLEFSGHMNADDTYENPYHVIEMSDSQSNVVDSLRGTNMEFKTEKGITFECWVKCDNKATFESSSTANNNLYPVVNIYTKSLEKNKLFSSGFNYYKSGSTGNWYLYYGADSYDSDASYAETSYIATENPERSVEISNPEEWNHIAYSVSSTDTKIYLNGVLRKTLTHVTNGIPTIDVLYGDIGSSLNINTSTGEFERTDAEDFSIDEFRFWNTARTESQIKKSWWTQVGGGTNTDDANVDLGVYYKFNEGIYGEEQYDKNVLDYSGRQTDTIIINYASGARSNTNTPLTSEFKDPVIYPTHPDIASLLSTYESVGKYYDRTNTNKMYNMVPTWISEEDEKNNSEVLKDMIQIMSSYLDTLYLQIEKYPEVIGSQEVYSRDNESAESTTRSMLQNKGFIVPELFADASLMEKFQHRNDKEKFEKELSVVKDLIYKNIHNNSSNILKSKGTEKSLRNLFRCFGVDEELLKIRVYPVNEKIELDKPRVYETTIKKRYADFFSTAEHRSGTLFSYGIPSESTYGVITGSDGTDSIDNTTLDMSSVTFECETYFPKRYSLDGRDMLFNNILTSSIGGLLSVHDLTGPPDQSDPRLDYGETEETTQDANDTGNFRIRFIKDSVDSTTGYFSLLVSIPSSSATGTPVEENIELTSSAKFDVYDNQRWNLSVRLGEKTNYADFMSGSAQDYKITFSGYNYEASTLKQEFSETVDLPDTDAITALTVSRRAFVGADVTNHTGSTASTLSDVMVSSVRYWLDWLPDETIKEHALYPSSFGNDPIDNSYYYDSGLTGTTIAGKQINKMDLLALNWDLSQIDTCTDYPDPGDEFYYTRDLSHSTPTGVQEIDNKTNKKYTGRFHFPNLSSPTVSDITKVKQILGAKQSEIDYLRDSDLINIKQSDSEAFKLNADPVSNKISVEKSYSAAINDEILKYFSGMKYFSNLIGRPVNKYRIKYKEIDYFRRKLFNLFNPTNDPNKEPDIEKFLEYYKWIDESINIFIGQMTPITASNNSNALNIIESHLLERSKYHHKFPTIDNYGTKRTEELSANLRHSGNRKEVLNRASQERQKATYIQFTNAQGQSRVFLSTDTVEYRNGVGGQLEYDTASNVNTLVNAAGNIYFDFN